MHTPHDDVHTHGLADDCPRCAEAAEQPWRELDQAVFLDLVTRTLANRFGGDDSPYGERVEPRSTTEAVAMATVMTMFERIGRVAELAPESLALYLRDRWHLEAEIANPTLDAVKERLGIE